MKKSWIIILAVLGFLLIVGGGCFSWVRSNYDRVIAMREATRGQWAQVENQLQRRYDLIPNLVETVKGYASHERELFEHIADARKAYFGASGANEKIAASQRMESALARLLVVVERYPDLKANQSFLKLQDSLEGTENRISVERKRYNDAVRMLNTYIQSFYGRFISSIAGVEMGEYFEVSEEAQAVPQVQF
ncbi:LemA family protein [candidate division KSB1 bacterium]